MTLKLIAGLRNPGSTYDGTRHNVGSWFVRTLVKHYHAEFQSEKKMLCEMARFKIHDCMCYAILPLTFMNQSGAALRAASQFYRIQPEDIIVAHDDLDLATGRIKLKTGGGNGGHNGLRDIIAHLHSPQFHRLRFGIGHPGDKNMVLKHVLSKLTPDEERSIAPAIQRAIDIMPILITDGSNIAMNILNKVHAL